MARVDNDFRVESHHLVSQRIVHIASEVFFGDLATLDSKVRSADFAEEKCISSEDAMLSIAIEQDEAGAFHGVAWSMKDLDVYFSNFENLIVFSNFQIKLSLGSGAENNLSASFLCHVIMSADKICMEMSLEDVL